LAVNVQIDRALDRPLYQQIVRQLQTLVRDGKLPVGAQLPTVRALAEQLGVTRLTVHNAYRQLKAEGWLESTVGRGTFVRASPQPRTLEAFAEGPISTDRFLGQSWSLGEAVGARNLAYAHPDPALFPQENFWRALSAQRGAAQAFQYACTQGEPELRVELARLAAGRGIAVAPDDLLVTSGVTQGISLAAQALAEPGDWIAVEQPTYLGVLHVAKAQGLRVAGVPLDEEGPRLDALERLTVQRRPRFFYTVPTYHNPTGRSMSAARRRGLLALAERHALPLVEDDIYARLSYDDTAPPPLKRDDPGGLVVYLDGFSKSLLPGLRIGYLIAPERLQAQLLTRKRAADLCGQRLTQYALAEFLRRGEFQGHLKAVNKAYRARRDVLVRALERALPGGVGWTRPEGGFCCWLTVPGRPDVGALYRRALAQGLVFTPGDVFLAAPEADGHLRLCFGFADADVLREGVALLADLLRAWLEEAAPAERAARAHAPMV